MSELKVESIKPAFGNKVTISPGILVTNNQDVSKFEVSYNGNVYIMSPLYIGNSSSNSAGNDGQVLTSAGNTNPPVWKNTFPVGSIILWTNSIASIPTGWVLCNGLSGTVDLREKIAGVNFIMKT